MVGRDRENKRNRVNDKDRRGGRKRKEDFIRKRTIKLRKSSREGVIRKREKIVLVRKRGKEIEKERVEGRTHQNPRGP